jgi:hypothetical protein
MRRPEGGPRFKSPRPDDLYLMFQLLRSKAGSQSSNSAALCTPMQMPYIGVVDPRWFLRRASRHTDPGVSKGIPNVEGKESRHLVGR